MFGGYYTIASGLMTREKEIDVIGNNMTNMQTPGYRAERLVIGSFDQELLMRQDATSKEALSGSMSTSAVVDSVVSLYHSGILKPTGREMDVAINGEGFFTIEAENGETYLTRDGQFHMDEDGYLELPGIGRVQSQSGDIKLEDHNFTVDVDGSIYDDEAKQVGKIAVAVPDANGVLEKASNGMFQLANGNLEYATDGFAMIQGSVEVSNGDMNLEMTTLIEAQRAFQSCSSALQTIDAMNRKAASQIGSI